VLRETLGIRDTAAMHSLLAVVLVCSLGAPAAQTVKGNPQLRLVRQVSLTLLLPEVGSDGSPVSQWHLGHLVTKAMRETQIAITDAAGAAAILKMATLAGPRRSFLLPELEVRVNTKRQGAFVHFAVWLRLGGDGLDPISYFEQGVTMPAEEGRSIYDALGKSLQKLVDQIESARGK
jgi:hypothetical protein